MTDEIDSTEGQGLDRRQMLKRTALVGGTLVWATPVVQSIGGTAFATETGSPGGGGGGAQALSEVTFAIKCGDTYAWGKYLNGGTGAPAECDTDLNIPESNGANPDLTCEAAEDKIDGLIPAGATKGTCVTGSVDANGTLCLTVPAGCTLVGWTVHDGFGDGTGNHCAYWTTAGSGGRANGDGYTLTVNGSTYCFSKVV